MTDADAPIVDAEVVRDELPPVSTREGRIARGLEDANGRVLALTAEEAAREHSPRAVAVRQQPTGVLTPIATPVQMDDAMKQYQATVAAVLSPSDWQDAGSDGKFVKKSGWRKIAKAFGLSVEIVRSEVERDEDGNPERASVVARAIAPNGQTSDGDGYCSVDEKRFGSNKGKQKLENDLRATATTRAKNRAISDLVGMGEVSAEEMAVMSAPTPPMLDEASPDGTAFKKAFGALVGDPAKAQAAYLKYREAQGGIPLAAADLLRAIQGAK